MTAASPLPARCALTLIALALCACTTQQWYGAGQAWRHGECQREANEADYRRCVASANVRYETYVREREADRRAADGSNP
jgi:hypothetical protein